VGNRIREAGRRKLVKRGRRKEGLYSRKGAESRIREGKSKEAE
jgi:hypothetical protein